MLDNRQTEPGATNLAGPCAIDTVKPLKDPVMVLTRNSDSGIADFDQSECPVLSPGDGNLAAGGSVFEAVCEKIFEDRPQRTLVGLHDDFFFGWLDEQLHLTRLSQCRKPFGH